MTSVVGQDHLDLLVAAGLTYRLVADPTSHAFGQAGSFFSARSANEIGRLLQQQNQASLDWLSRLGRARLADRGHRPPYVYEPVAARHIVPVEVLKACQAFEHACQPAPGWPGSRARQYVAALTAAAVRRLPGYAEAPWLWVRPPSRSGPPIAYGAAWRPAIEGLLWVSQDRLVEQWHTARLVVVTVDVAAILPALPSRPALFVLTRQEIPDEVWPAVEGLGPEGIVFYPVAEPWLSERLRPEVDDLSEVRP